MQELAGKINTKDFEFFVTLCWVIWHSRNLLIFERKKEDPAIPVAKAEATIEAYRRIKSSHMQTNTRKKNELTWKPTPKGWFKVNTDATIQIQDQRVRLGILIRDSKGGFVAAAMKTSKFFDNITYTEAEAINLGFEVAGGVAIQSLVMESDCLEAVNQISAKQNRNNAELSWIILEVQNHIQRLKEVKVQFAPCCCNGIAHELAKKALNVNEPVQWLGTCPPHLLYLFS